MEHRDTSRVGGRRKQSLWYGYHGIHRTEGCLVDSTMQPDVLMGARAKVHPDVVLGGRCHVVGYILQELCEPAPRDTLKCRHASKRGVQSWVRRRRFFQDRAQCVNDPILVKYLSRARSVALDAETHMNVQQLRATPFGLNVDTLDNSRGKASASCSLGNIVFLLE